MTASYIWTDLSTSPAANADIPSATEGVPPAAACAAPTGSRTAAGIFARKDRRVATAAEFSWGVCPVGENAAAARGWSSLRSVRHFLMVVGKN